MGRLLPSATDQSLQVLWVASALCRDLRGGGLDLVEVVGREIRSLRSSPTCAFLRAVREHRVDKTLEDPGDVLDVSVGAERREQ
jgi:hypothetical protein